MKISINIIKRGLLFIIFLSLLIISQRGFAQENPDEKKKTGVNVIITQSPKIFVKLEAVTHNMCNGDSKGAINISAYGGYPPYKYYWDNGDTTQDVAGLKAGRYRVAVYDKFSCSDTMEVFVTEPMALKSEVTKVKDILCYGYNHGEIDITVSGGTAPYRFKWNNGSTTEDITGLTSGRYSVLITDANGCQDIVTADVEEKPLIIRFVDDVTNIKCSGDSTGTIDISVSGGIPPYAYQWSNGAQTEDLKNLKAGNYEIVVKDAGNCTEVSTVMVKEPKPLTISFDEVRNLRCNGDGGGVVNINVTGGIVPYTYHWNNGIATQDLIGIPAGKYKVDVVDKNGCKKSVQAEIVEPPVLNVNLINSKNVSYYGGKDGAIEVEVSGGVSPYKYKWNNDSETRNISNLGIGAYSLRVTDASGCAKIINVAITQPQPLQVKLENSKNILCHNDQTGEINIAVIGGVPPYQFAWSNGAKQQNISGVKAGKYSVTVTDANGHKQTLEETLTEPPAFEYQILSVNDILCHNYNTGAIDLEVKGGVLPYRYRWNNGQSSQDLKDVPAGEYAVKITDANQCELNATAVVKQPESLNLELASTTNISCFDESTGAININVSGGVLPYTFKWDNGATTQNLSGLKAGRYSVLVTDKNGCSKEVATELIQPTLLVVDEQSVKNVDCFGNNTGAIGITVKGGVTPYSYAWSNGETGKNISNLKKGNYSVKVTDANGCSSSFARTITEPEKLVKSLEAITNILCYGDTKGAVSIKVSGGVQPYSYRWSNGATSQNIVNVKAGNYSVFIRDANGCTDSLSAKVDQNQLLNSSAAITHIKCNSDKTGMIGLTVEGGVGPYVYNWSNGSTTKDLNNIPAGNYSVTITDAKGCVRIQEAQVSEPPKFFVSLASETDILCNGESTGNINIRANGGVHPYKFKWSNNDTTQNLKNIAAGKYVLTATDVNGCIQSVTTTLTQPSPIVYSVKSVTNLLCNDDRGGAIDVVVSGGVGPFEYKWNNGASTQDLSGIPAGTYQLQLRDANGCIKTLETQVTQPEVLSLELDSVRHILCFGESKGSVNIKVKGGTKPYKYSWSNGAVTQNIANVSAGNYSVTVTDANGCSETIFTSVKQPDALVAKVDQIRQLACFGDKNGSVTLSVNGGVKPYQYKWSNGSTTQDLSNLAAGTYTVTISDANGCSQNLTAVITQPVKLVSSLTHTSHVSCYGASDGLVDITVVGGTAPYAYQWSNDISTQDLNYVRAGNYSVKIKDARGCTDSLLNIAVNQPNPLVANITTVNHILKYGQNAGAINLEVTGGMKPYVYSWSNGATTQHLSAIPGGNYSVKVKDANGCISNVSTVVNQPQPLSLQIVAVKDISCYNETAGSIEVKVTGGAPPYSFEWNNGATSQNLTNVPAGDYSLRVTDSNGNNEVLSSKIAQPSQLIVKEVAAQHVLCNNDATGSVNVTVSGGTAPYQYQWSNGAKTKDLTAVKSGTYTLAVTDSYGCKTILEKVIQQPEPFVAKVRQIDHVNCTGESKGAVELEVTGGTTPYAFAWSNGEKIKDINNARAGKYDVVITDANGCKNTLEAIINQPTELFANVASITNNLCFGEEKGSINLDVKGGSAPYRFTWSNGATTQNLNNIPKGDYVVNIVDDKGCSKEVKASVTEPVLLAATLAKTTNVLCFDETKGSVKVDVIGGTKPYAFQWNNKATTQNLESVAAGDYELTVKDANGCISKVRTTIQQPELLTLSLDTIYHIMCEGSNTGFIDVNVNGGVSPYSYTWSNGVVSEDLVNAMAGTYTLTVKDANGCTEKLSATINQPGKLIVTLEDIEHLKCAGDATGEINVKVTGGAAPYKYSWSNGETSAQVRNLKAGDYRLMVTDANNCSAVFHASVNEPPALVKSIDAISDIRCNGENSGSIIVSVSEGTLPYKFEWNNGVTTKDLRGASAGNYKLVITEGNGCQTTLEANIEEPTPFHASVTNVAHVRCFGEKTGRIDVAVDGGVLPYKFAWSNGSFAQNIEELGADSYALMVTDANGCIRSVHAEITEPALLTLSIDSVKNVNCCGDNSGAIYITVDGGIKPYKYEWSNGATTEDIENLILGVYTVNVTDANNCVVSTPDNMTLYEQVVSKGMFTTRDINFDVAKSIIKSESFSTINRIASFMKEYPDISFRIDGHTDSDGSDEFNQKLSEERAQAIKEALIKFGIRENRLAAKGWGESKPVVPNTTAANKALNRRVEFIALTGTIEGTLIENQIREIQ